MSSGDSWIETFNITQKTLESWREAERASLQSGVGSGVAGGPLFWALVHGQVPESTYFDWAQATFELPLVTGDFFAIPFDDMFWERVKTLHAWSPSLMPLSEWDGILYIACVEPPKEFHFRAPHRFVLASARQLQLLWSHLNPAAESENNVHEMNSSPEAPVAVPEMPDGFRSETMVGSGLVNMGDQLPDGIVTGEPGHGFNDLTPDPNSDLPDGMNFGSTDLPEPEPAVSASATSDDEVDPFSMPDGFGPAVTSPKIEFNFNTQPLKSLADLQAQADVTPFEEETRETPDESPVEPVIETPVFVETPAAPVIEAPAPVVLAAPAPAVEPEPVPETPSELSSGVPEFTITQSPDFNWVMPVDPMALDRTTNTDELILHALSAMARHFTGAMLFLNTADGFRVWKFTAPFRTPKDDYGPVDFTQPNIFRIVRRTSIPFHGPVSPAPENDRFFRAYLGGIYPRHASVVPIIYEKTQIGMFLGIADSELPYKHLLPLMERLASEFAKGYARLNPASDAA